jgi:hypothetical protein
MSQPTVWDRIVRRRSGGAAVELNRIPTRLKGKWRDLVEAREAAEAARRPRTVEELQVELRDFYAHYEPLVEVLCDCAQYGPETPLEAKYADLRSWMQAHYPSVRGEIAPFMSSRGLTASGADDFEVLFLAPSLAEFLRADDGNMIMRIMATRQALTDLADHLRAQVA